MIETIEHTIGKHALFDAASPALLMVSGGSDSTALAYIMADLHARGLVGPLACLHVNHKLRGRDAEDDQVFVAALAEALDIPFFCCEVDVALLARETGGNVAAIGRQERYIAGREALESLCMHAAVPIAEGRIITAHTQDDRVENFYMRSIKGTGPGGFRSMLYRNGPIVRPLMDASRADLRAVLACAAILRNARLVVKWSYAMNRALFGVRMRRTRIPTGFAPTCVTRSFLQRRRRTRNCSIRSAAR